MKEVTLEIARFDPEKRQQKWVDTFVVPTTPLMSVLEALFYVVENLDGSLAFRYSCRGAVCGSCAMSINGQRQLACQTLIRSLKSKTLHIAPLPHLKVIKDLIVDLDAFFEKYRKVKPYLINDQTAPTKERRQSIGERKKIDEMINCLLCGACYSACTLAATDSAFLGPAALTKLYRFYADSRDTGSQERLKLIGGEDGVFRCHTLFNCAAACPKAIVPTYSIQKLKGASLHA